MVAVTMGATPHPLRRRSDPARPLPWWVPVLLIGVGLGLSVLGWATTLRLDATEDVARSAAQDAGTAQQHETAAEEAARAARAERDALAAIVVQRCDTGQIRDVQLCDAARGVWTRPGR